jgi:glycosyltransferase involved in cell wall biosynthesis
MADGLEINLIALDNGLGLSRDVVLLKAALEANGCRVHVTRLDRDDEHRRWRVAKGWRRLAAHARHRLARRFGRARFDVNVMLEHVWPLHLPLARHNVILPNPEWFDAKDLRHLKRVDRAWAKTRQAEELFRGLGLPVSWIGFDSHDRRLDGVTPQRAFFHLAGGSRLKGTDRLLALWGRHPEWPMLTLVRHGAPEQGLPANVQVHAGYLDDMELRRLQNGHRFHLCPSEAEGYGHYLAEAMWIGAVAITVDAAPMNELVDASRGLLVRAAPGRPFGLVPLQYFDEAAMERAVAEALALSHEACVAIGARARAWVEDNRARFPERLAAALEALARS